MIKLSDFGEMLMKQEYIVDLDNDKIVSITYVGKDKDNNPLSILVESSNDIYNCQVNSNKFKIQGTNLFNISANEILSRASMVNSENSPVMIRNYDNSNNKDEYSYTIDFSDSISINVDKDQIIEIDPNYFAKLKNQYKESNTYHIHNYGLYINEASEKMTYLLNDQNWDKYKLHRIELSNFKQNPIKIPNLYKSPSVVIKYQTDESSNAYTLEYDDYGVLTSGNNTLYEAYNIDEFKYPIFVISLHKFFGDMFDTSIVPTDDIYCIDQIDRGLDENVVIYTREVYKIEDNRKLEEVIKTERFTNKPSIETLD